MYLWACSSAWTERQSVLTDRKPSKLMVGSSMTFFSFEKIEKAQAKRENFEKDLK